MQLNPVISYMIVAAAFISACSTSVPATVSTVTTVSGDPLTPSITPSFILTSTPSLTPSPTDIPVTATEPAVSPGCIIVNKEGQLYVLSDREFRDLWSHEKEIDQALAATYPEWGLYEQAVPWDTKPVKLGEIINSASLDEVQNLQINSKVTLVTLGLSLDWQLPANSDLYLKSQEISLKLNDLASDWERPGSEALHAQFPEVTNAATYALYISYDQDIDRLRTWCDTYQKLFGSSNP